MPYIHISTSVRLDEARTTALRQAVSELIPLIPGKTADVTMIHIDAEQQMHLKDEGVPCAFVDLRLKGPAPFEAKQRFAEAFGRRLSEITGVDARHTYLNVIELAEWGAGGGYSHL